MRTKTKIILLCLCSLLLVVATVTGTLAYLVAKDSTVNTFTVGKVEMKLDEAPVDENGKKTSGDRVITNEYKMIPGRIVDKDPTVTVLDGSESSYIRMILTIYNEPTMSQIVNSDKHGLGGDYAGLLGGWDTQKWLYNGFVTDTTAKTISFEFRYYMTVGGATGDVILEPLFEQLIIPATLTGEEIKSLGDGGFKIEVTAHAIQSEGFADADEAWGAFDVQMQNS